MSQKLVVIGGGEHARVVVDAARSCGDRWLVVGYVDSRVCDEMQALGVPRIGDDSVLGASEHRASAFVIGVGGVGETAARMRIAERASGLSWATVIHERAVVSSTARIEPGAVVLAGAVVNTAARVGPHVILNTAAVIEHDVVLGACVHVAPGAIIGGGAILGAGAYVGLGARIRDHVRIGEFAVVGMGAVVLRDVTAGARVIGVPARDLPKS